MLFILMVEEILEKHWRNTKNIGEKLEKYCRNNGELSRTEDILQMEKYLRNLGEIMKKLTV